MRRAVLLAHVGLALGGGAAVGCGVGGEEDGEARRAVAQAVARQRVDVPFSWLGLTGARDRVWFFGGATTPEVIERELGHPWPGAPDAVGEGTYVVVLDGGPGRVRGFRLDLPETVSYGCLPAGVPLPAAQGFVLRRDPVAAVPGSSRLDAVGRDCP